MQRGGYEAMCWGRALLTSDTAVLREFFGDAASYTKPDGASIAEALSAALASAPALRNAIQDRRGTWAAEQLRQLAQLETDMKSRIG
jgi:glycosyltransferase involved in cell wall biosynthesis